MEKHTFWYGFPGELLFLGGGNSNIFGIFIPIWGILTNIFQMGWNHQIVFILIIRHSICIFPSQMSFCMLWLPNEQKCSNFLVGVYQQLNTPGFRQVDRAKTFGRSVFKCQVDVKQITSKALLVGNDGQNNSLLNPYFWLG